MTEAIYNGRRATTLTATALTSNEDVPLIAARFRNYALRPCRSVSLFVSSFRRMVIK